MVDIIFHFSVFIDCSTNLLAVQAASFAEKLNQFCYTAQREIEWLADSDQRCYGVFPAGRDSFIENLEN
jgi:hypothetical protein